LLRLTAILTTLVLTAAPAFAVDPAAKAFVEGLYRTYPTSEEGLDIKPGAKAARYFTASTATLVAKDQDHAAERGDVGRLGSDPLVTAQDWAATKIDIVVQDGARPDRARARASFKFPGEEKQTVIALDLMKTSAGWRVSDVAWKGQRKSLRQILNDVRE
jgi:hypothetical protein